MKYLRRYFGRLPRRNPDGKFESPIQSVRRDMIDVEKINLTLDLSRAETLAKSQLVAEVCYAGE